MRCIYCQRYEHKRHKPVMEHADGSADVCDCDRCNAGVAQVEEQLTRNEQVVSSTLTTGYEGPPPHPEAFDHGRWRVAEEPIGTDLFAPWIVDYCTNCRKPTFTHNHIIAAKHETLCEECAFLMLQDLTDTKVKQNRQRPRFFSPFESRQ